MVEEVTQQDEQTVGTILRNARLKKGKTIADVADELCIRKVYINAIENMDYTNIPPLPYGIGFIRSYAQYLGLNSDRVVASYRQSFLAKNDNHQSENPKNMETSTPHFKHIFIGLCGLAALFIAWSVLPVSEPVEDYREDAAGVVPEPVIVEEDADEDAKAELRAEDLKDGVIETAEQTTVPTEENGEEKSAADNAENPAGQTSEAQQNTEAATQNDAEVSEDETPQAEEEFIAPKMKMVLSGPSWIELKQGETVLIKGDVYNKGFEYEIPSEEGITITVGRPRNAAFYLDGQPIKVVSVMKRKNVSLDEFFQKQN